ncbi:MAG: hypothetical protein R2705_10265 [Ilumatobacteraceae bacterium]
MMQGISQMLAVHARHGLGSMVGQLATRALASTTCRSRDRATSCSSSRRRSTSSPRNGAWGVTSCALWVQLPGARRSCVVLNVPTQASSRRAAPSGSTSPGSGPIPAAISEKFGSLDLGDADAIATLQQTLGDPEVLLGGGGCPSGVAARLDALVSVVIGAVDHVVDQAASQ